MHITFTAVCVILLYISQVKKYQNKEQIQGLREKDYDTYAVS